MSTFMTVSLALLTGFSAGLVNGLLGAGGGIIAVWGLGRLLRGRGTSGRDVFANALTVMLPLSMVSVLGYSGGTVDYHELGLLVLPAIAGGLCGALALDHIRVDWLKLIFSAVVIYSGFKMLFG